MKRSVLVAVVVGSAALAAGCSSKKEAVREATRPGAIGNTPTPSHRPEVNAGAAERKQTQHAGSDRPTPSGGERP